MTKLYGRMLQLPSRLLGTPGIAPPRRHDLDWLRVGAFGLLIFYHIGMLYVARWGYHYKSHYTSTSLESVMLLVNPWRMPVLWLVSGIAIRFILAKINVWRFIGFRTLRLLLPLLFAILVIIPPQLFYEMSYNGDLAVSYGEFYRAFFILDHPMFTDYRAGIWPHMDVNHLWYLRELWLFSLYLLCLLPILNRLLFQRVFDWMARQRGTVIFLFAAAPILAIELGIEDNREQMGFAFLVYGYILGWHEAMWSRLKQGFPLMLGLGVVCYISLVFAYNLVWVAMPEPRPDLMQLMVGVIYALSRLSWLFAVLGLAASFLNRPSRKLDYLNEAVYPYYILHQTIIIVAAAQLSRFTLGPVFEPLLVIASTFIGCYLGFELIKRVLPLRPLFGLKVGAEFSKNTVRAGYVLAALILTPFALEILI